MSSHPPNYPPQPNPIQPADSAPESSQIPTSPLILRTENLKSLSIPVPTDDENLGENSHEAAPATLSDFLWQLLSPSLEDDTVFSNSREPSNRSTASATRHFENQPEPIQIEFVKTKRSLIDLSPNSQQSSAPLDSPPASIMVPTTSAPKQIPASTAHRSSGPVFPVASKSPDQSAPGSSVSGIASSLLSYGKAFFASTIQRPHSPPSLISSDSLASATRQERDSVLDLHVARRPVTLDKGKLPEHAEVILTPVIAEKLRPNLSPIYRESSTWRLVYSLDHHGISLNTLYNKCESEAGSSSPVLLVIKDSDGSLFGGFANEPFRVQHGYYGNGSCFLWKAIKEKHGEDHHHSGDAPQRVYEIEVLVYKATGLNDYLILGESHMIALGGGEGHFGLWVDQDLYNGHSGPCQTFNNDQLSKKAEFVVQSLEIWAFDI